MAGQLQRAHTALILCATSVVSSKRSCCCRCTHRRASSPWASPFAWSSSPSSSSPAATTLPGSVCLLSLHYTGTDLRVAVLCRTFRTRSARPSRRPRRLRAAPAAGAAQPRPRAKTVCGCLPFPLIAVIQCVLCSVEQEEDLLKAALCMCHGAHGVKDISIIVQFHRFRLATRSCARTTTTARTRAGRGSSRRHTTAGCTPHSAKVSMGRKPQ